MSVISRRGALVPPILAWESPDDDPVAPLAPVIAVDVRREARR
jgi:hypothetical protein